MKPYMGLLGVCPHTDHFLNSIYIDNGIFWGWFPEPRVIFGYAAYSGVPNGETRLTIERSGKNDRCSIICCNRYSVKQVIYY